MANYPAVSKLKDKYSPQKRIPPLSSGSLANAASNPHPKIDTRHEMNRGGFSPIRRSGSPVRRLNITQIEQQNGTTASESTSGRLKRNRDEADEQLPESTRPLPPQTSPEHHPKAEEPTTKKAKGVTFSSEVELKVLENDTSAMDEDSVGTDRYDEMVFKLDQFVHNVNQRLDSLQANQKWIIRKLETSRNEELHEKCHALQASLNELIQAIRKPDGDK